MSFSKFLKVLSRKASVCESLLRTAGKSRYKDGIFTIFCTSYFWFSKIEHAQKALKKPEEEKLITFIPSADVSLVPKVTSTCQL